MTNPATVMAAIQAMLNGPNTLGYGPQSGLVAAMATLHEELAANGIAAPDSLGVGLREDRAAIDAAAVLAARAGEPDVFVSSHDAQVYSPIEMATQVHKQLAAMGWAATSTQLTIPAGQGVLYPAAYWRSSLDQSGLAGSHVALGTGSRQPTTLPDGAIINASKLPGARVGKAYAANVPAGATKVEAQPNIPAPLEGWSRWFGFSVQLSRGCPVEDPNWQVLWRVRANSDGSYPLGLVVHDGQLRVAAANGSGTLLFDQPIAPVRTRTWHDVVIRATSSATVGLCSIDAWVDGKGIIGYQPPLPLLAAGQTYTYRYGLYRSTASPGEATAFYQNVAYGFNMGGVLLPGAG